MPYNSSYDPPSRPVAAEGPPELSDSEKRDKESTVRSMMEQHLAEMGVDPSMAGHYVRKFVTFKWMRSGSLLANEKHGATYARSLARDLLPKIPAKHGGNMRVAAEPLSAEEQARLEAKRAEVSRSFSF